MSKAWGLIPVKRLALAKGRLAAVLAPAERAKLATAMAEDVLRAAGGARHLHGIAVVTADPAVAALARRHGARVIDDDREDGVRAAVTLGARQLARDGAAVVLVVPADVPLVRPDDLDHLLAQHRPSPAVTLVPALADGGTNAVVCGPPAVIPFQFGPDSLHRHCRAARRAGVEPTVLALPRLGRDLDRPEDLPPFLAEGEGTRSHAVLAAAADASSRPALRASFDRELQP